MSKIKPIIVFLIVFLTWSYVGVSWGETQSFSFSHLKNNISNLLKTSPLVLNEENIYQQENAQKEVIQKEIVPNKVAQKSAFVSSLQEGANQGANDFVNLILAYNDSFYTHVNNFSNKASSASMVVSEKIKNIPQGISTVTQATGSKLNNFLNKISSATAYGLNNLQLNLARVKNSFLGSIVYANHKVNSVLEKASGELAVKNNLTEKSSDNFKTSFRQLFSNQKNNLASLSGAIQNGGDAIVEGAGNTALTVYYTIADLFKKTGDTVVLLGDKVNPNFSQGLVAFGEIVAPETKVIDTVKVPVKVVVAETPKEEPTIVRNVTQTNVTNPIREVVKETVIERVVSGVSLADLQNLSNQLHSEIYKVADSVSSNNANLYRTISLTNKIDNLSGVTISGSTINTSSFSGSTGSFSGAFTGTTGSFSGDLSALTGAFTGNLSSGGQLSITGTATSTLAGDTAFDTNTLYVDSLNNRVGVGTSSPTDTFSLNGPAYLAQVSAPANTSNRLYNTAGDLYWAGSLIGGASTGNWATDGTSVWRPSGNVGIGTTSPFAKLSVAGNGYFDGTLTASTITATSSIVAPYFTANSATATSTFAGGLTVGTNKLVVDRSTGYVGLGNASPLYPLDIVGQLTVGGIRVYGDYSGGATAILVEAPTGAAAMLVTASDGHPATYRMGQDGLRRWGVRKNSDSETGSNSGSNFEIESFTDAGSHFEYPFLITRATGYIGMGTSSPFARLSVAGNGYFDGTLTASTITATSSIVSPYFTANSATATSTFAGGLTVGTNKLVVDRSTGYVGVGTNSPVSKLDVRGRITSLNSSITGMGLLDAWLNVGSYYTSGVFQQDASLNDNSWKAGAGLIYLGAGDSQYGFDQTFIKTRSTDGSTQATVLGGDELGVLNFFGDNGSGDSLRAGAKISATVDTTTSVAPGTYYMPGRIGFFTTANTVASPLTERMRINSSGNVGIGTVATTPLGRLHARVAGVVTATTYDGYFNNIATNATTDGIHKYGMYITSTGNFVGAAGGTANNNYALYVDTPSGADNNYAAIFAGGNVGVGTTSPFAKLSVAGNGYFDGTLTASTITATSSIVAPYFTANSATATSTFAGGLTVGTNKLVVDRSTGDVGLGNASPLYPLDIVGQLTVGGIRVYGDYSGGATAILVEAPTGAAAMLVTASDGHPATYRMGQDGLRRWGVRKNSDSETGSNSGSNFEIESFTDAGSHFEYPFLITRATGYIGMGTSSPFARLSVAG